MKFISAIVAAALLVASSAFFGAASALRAQETGSSNGSSRNGGGVRDGGGQFGEFRPNGFDADGLQTDGAQTEGLHSESWRTGSLRAESSRRYPDIETWQTEDDFIEEMFHNPSVSMTSTVEVVRRELPQRIIVLPNNTVRIWRVNVSNGSAGNWGSFPNSYLDARTLSFPASR